MPYRKYSSCVPVNAPEQAHGCCSEEGKCNQTSDPVHRLWVWLWCLGVNQWFKVSRSVQCCSLALCSCMPLWVEKIDQRGEGPMLHFADTLLIGPLLLQLTFPVCSSWPMGYHGSFFGIRAKNLSIDECMLHLFSPKPSCSKCPALASLLVTVHFADNHSLVSYN